MVYTNTMFNAWWFNCKKLSTKTKELFSETCGIMGMKSIEIDEIYLDNTLEADNGNKMGQLII